MKVHYPKGDNRGKCGKILDQHKLSSDNWDEVTCKVCLEVRAQEKGKSEWEVGGSFKKDGTKRSQEN